MTSPPVDATPESRLRGLGLVLPPQQQPAGCYCPVVVDGTLALVSGHGPLPADVAGDTGRVGAEVGVLRARELARDAALHCLSSLRAAIGSLDRVGRVLRLAGMVCAVDGFVDHPAVIDGASELLLEVFGERGRHSRYAVGVASLPFGIPVELELTVRLRGSG
ncbi:MAG: RidA family protein [Pseudonocardia sp.]|nr:RidA family protein [Pseudonocardia sp.]